VRFAANLSILFTEHPLSERPAAAAACGLRYAELWWPFATPEPADHEIDGLLRAFDDAGVQLTGLNFYAGDMAAGDRGIVSHPGESKRFRSHVDIAVGIAERAGCKVLNALYGNRLGDTDPAAQRETAIENYGIAARSAERIGATVVLEAINTIENPRYPITTTAQAREFIEKVEAETGGELALLYDAYHMQRMEGNLIETIRTNIDRIGHVQIADSPTRSQPGTGEINYPNVLDKLDESGYEGLVGIEYRPLGCSSAESLGWMQNL
jgi:hydroxypyruvate isomerase